MPIALIISTLVIGLSAWYFFLRPQAKRTIAASVNMPSAVQTPTEQPRPQSAFQGRTPVDPNLKPPLPSPVTASNPSAGVSPNQKAAAPSSTAATPSPQTRAKPSEPTPVNRPALDTTSVSSDGPSNRQTSTSGQGSLRVKRSPPHEKPVRCRVQPVHHPGLGRLHRRLTKSRFRRSGFS